MNSSSGASTVVPAGSAAAIGASNWETPAPTHTSATGTPTNPANAVRDRSAAAPHPSHEVAPTCHSPSARCNASQPGRGGSP